VIAETLNCHRSAATMLIKMSSYATWSIIENSMFFCVAELLSYCTWFCNVNAAAL